MKGKTGIAWLAAGMILAGATAAYSNMATPRQKWSQIRMVSEHVRVILSPTRADVVGTYVLKNEGEAITQVVGYPRGVLEKSLDDFTVTADGENVGAASQAREGLRTPASGSKDKPVTLRYQFEGPYPEWKVFNLHFEKDQVRTVVVRYHVAPGELKTGEGRDLLAYAYILRTGATWKGNIEKGIVEVSLESLKQEEVVSVTPAPESRAGSLIVWTFKDFKPNADIEITFRLRH